MKSHYREFFEARICEDYHLYCGCEEMIFLYDFLDILSIYICASLKRICHFTYLHFTNFFIISLAFIFKL